jgi:hypothetical protein
MHFEILVEDQSGKKMLDVLVPKILGAGHTFKIHPYKGIGRIPKGLTTIRDGSKRILLDQLPHLLRGYGNTFSKYPPNYHAAVILVCDLDNKCPKDFHQDLLNILNTCDPKPKTQFCFAIEEGEAWLLGDLQAVKYAYPRAKDVVLNAYVNDSICGTWECLADAVFNGGSAALSKKGWQAIGTEKCHWAENISPYMNISNNKSNSFIYFRNELLKLASARN